MTISLFIFLIITVLIPFLNFYFQDSGNSNENKIIYIAHRGASTLAPENTLQAFELALKQNVDMIELDVHLSKDDSIIVTHDRNLKRTTDLDKNVGDLTYEEIQKAKIKDKDGNMTFEKVPTLDDVLKLINGKKKVLIELKSSRNEPYLNLVDKTLQCISKNKAEDWVAVQSFEKKYLEEIIEKNKSIECQQLIFGVSSILPVYFDTKIRFGKFEPIAGVSSVNIFYIYLNSSFVNRMHQKGIKVMTFTIDKKKDAQRAVNFGVDGIITNDVSAINVSAN